MVYKVTQTDGTVIKVDNPANLPERTKIEKLEEPYVTTIMVPSDFVGR